MANLLIAGYGFLGRALESKFEAAGWQVSKLNRSVLMEPLPVTFHQ